MDKGLILGTAIALVFGFLPFAVKSMPEFISWPGIAVGIAIAVGAMLPLKLQPSLAQSTLYIASIALFASTMGWQIPASNQNVAPDEKIPHKEPRLSMGNDKDNPKEKAGPIIGTDIDSSGGGVGLEINSSGSNGVPSVGGESIVQVPEGKSAIGTRIINRGSGGGLKVTQTGPGVGYSSRVIIVPKGNPSKSTDDSDK
ncbi:hypothetical protein [Rhizobium miluonense]|uniref:Uncharacterized protein n=1 Tax=Rhizobium miluonense TaxID=411945 RepID=A0ABU1SZD3_9HYPH|nr:hypothetical protein [Rhizobium miluonense]MDR6904268.1 hypothetical protein [Rhizobium miluonense]